MLGALAAEREVESLRVDIAAQVRQLFYDALAAQARTKIMEDLCADAESLARLMRTRFEQGDAPEADVMRAEADHQQYRADLENARGIRDALRAQLAELCGFAAGEMPECAGIIAPGGDALPDIAVLDARIRSTPRSAVRMLREEQAETQTKALRRAAIPEPALRVGLRRQDASGTNTLDIGVSVGLPIFDRNQGAVAASKAYMHRVLAENEAKRRAELRAALALRNEAAAAIAAAERLRADVIPRWEAICESMQKALDLGGASLFEVLSARRDLAQARLELLKEELAARNFMIALTALLGE